MFGTAALPSHLILQWRAQQAFFFTVFFADCEDELQKVTSGTRLCLAFNLVRGNNTFDMELEPGELKGLSSRIARVEAALRPWLDLMEKL